MTRKLYLLFFFAVSVSLILSCSKYNKMLDIDWDNMDVDGSMNWGVPLLNANYSIEQILTEFGAMGFIKYDSNGDYFFEFIIPQKEYLNVAEYNEIPNKDHNFLVEEIVTHTYIDISNDKIIVEKATLKSGQFKFDFRNAFSHTETDYDIVVTSTTVFNADHTDFVMNLSKNKQVESVSCAGLFIKPENSQLDFIVTIVEHNSSVNNLHFYPTITMADITLKEADIEILEEQSYGFTQTAEFSIFSEKISLNATIHNPKLLLNVTNTFGAGVNLKIPKAYIKGKTNTESIFLNDNTTIAIHPDWINPIEITQYLKKDIFLTTEYNELYFECVALLPKGKITIRDNSLVSAGMNFSIPFDITIDEAMFRDTMSFALSGLSALTFLDTVKIRTEFNSTIPANFSVQIYLYDSKTEKVISSLMPEPVNIKGSYNNTPVASDAQYVIITNDRIKELQQADNLILSLFLDTQGQHAPFNQKNSLHAKVGAHIRTATKF